MPTSFPLNTKKATQAVCRFIEKEGGEINHLKLMKLLYLADRTALLRWCMPIIGDRYCSMEYGPMLSGVLDLVNKRSYSQGQEYWNEYISERKRNKIHLNAVCDYDELSTREIELIDRISNHFIDKNEWDVVDFCHRALKEWTNPGNTSITISLEKMLNAAGVSEEAIREIQEENDVIMQVKELLQC